MTEDGAVPGLNHAATKFQVTVPYRKKIYQTRRARNKCFKYELKTLPPVKKKICSLGTEI